MLSSTESLRIQDLDTAGAATTRRQARSKNDRRGILIWFVAGLFVVLLACSAVLLRHLDESRRAASTDLQTGLEARARIAALATTTMLEATTGSVPDDIVRAQRLLSRMAASGDLAGVQLGLYFAPRAATPAQSGLLVASAPVRDGQRPFTPLAEHSGLDVLALLKSMCRADQPLVQPAHWTYSSDGRVLSMAPVLTAAGCWGVVTLRPETASPTIAASIQSPFAAMGSMTGLMASLLVLLSIALVYHFRRAFVWGAPVLSRDLVPAEAVRTAPVARMQSAPALAHDGMDRDALEELAHGLKTPVATIIQSLEPLRRNAAASEPNAQRSVQIIESASRRLIDLIQAIPAHAARTIEHASGQQASVTDVVHGAVMGLDTPSQNVRLRVIDMTPGNAILAGEPALLRAAVEHIVENAIDFSPAGGEVSVRITAGRSLAVVAIEDEGPGAAPEILPQIFNRYFSERRTLPPAASSAGDNAPNFGLGLWIARRNVEALHGRIFAENRRSGGLRLTISLPIAPSPER